MIIDCTDKSFNSRYLGTQVLVDGSPVKLVWFVDTDAGLVRTYDLGDNRARSWREYATVPNGTPLSPSGLFYRELRGAVLLIPPGVTEQGVVESLD